MTPGVGLPRAPAPSRPAGPGAGMRRLRASPFARHVAGTFGTRVLALALGVLSNLLLTRVLGPAGRGAYAAATTVTGTGVQLASLGLHASNTYNAGRDPRLAPALAANSLAAAFGVGGAGAGAALLFFLARPEAAPAGGWATGLALAAVPFAVAYLLLRGLLLGVREVGAHNRIELGTALLGAALVALVAAGGWAGVESLVGCALVTAAAGFAWSASAVRRRAGALPAPSRALFAATLRYGTKAYLAALLAFLAQRADILILTRMLGAGPTGHYAAAVSVAALAAVFPLSAGTILFPRLSGVADAAERWRLTRRVLAAVVAGMATVAALLVVAAPPVVRLLFGEAFVPAAAPLRWLMPGVLVLSANSILMNHFAAEGMPRVTVYSPAAALVVNVALNLALVPRLGTVGAALASGAGSATMLAASLVYLARRRGA